jgi:hypothetical protein
MTMKLNLCAVFSLVLIGLFATPAFSKPIKYVGVKKCKTCHKKAKDGNAYKIWSGTKHAKAFELLGSAKAKKKAKELGISKDPQKALECLICHVAGAQLPKSQFAKSFKATDGVQCENCHGPGSKYRKKKIMKKIRAERLKGKFATAKKVGLIHANEKTCTSQCHQPERVVDGVTYINPSFKPFNYKERLKKIAHPMPN